MLKNKFKNSKKVAVDPFEKLDDTFWYSQEDTNRDVLNELNESLFQSNSRLMKQLESVQMGF